MNITKIIYGSMIAVAPALIASCSDYLDVSPQSQVEDTDLFSSESGFKEALAGVYSSMVSEDTYEKEMLYGALSILAQEWTGYPSSTYDDLIGYDYTTTYSENIIDGIWSTSYNSIANVNNIINSIDDYENVFYDNNYSIIKGEALALRGFLHFDLLRCFGVSYAQNSSMPSIPYVKTLTYRVYTQSTVSEVAEAVLEDLEAAAELLKPVDPIVTGEEITELDDNGYLMNRQVHLNYYAVRATMARVYMWMGDYTNAAEAAKEVIDSEYFTWADGNYMSYGYDYSFATEQIFALNDVNMEDIADNYFNTESSSSSFSINQSTLLDYYDNETSDYRYLYLYASGTGDLSDYKFSLKFEISESDDDYYTDKLPLIRISEMYLILAECYYRDGDETNALAYIEELRTARNVVTTMTSLPDDFYDWLIREYRREFLGEGQLFFLYKRLNMETIIGSDVDVITTKAYTFPLPMSETDAAEREDNR